jgi:hypothetical protein
MTTKGRLATILIALTFFGCKGPLQTSAASAGEGASGVAPGDGASGQSSTVGGTRIEYITDPTMNNMRVMPVQIPASWRFRGVLVPKGPCTDTSEVFRATSPDGRSFVEVMPRMGFVWGNLYAGSRNPGGCLPFDKQVSALEFVKYMTTVLQVEFLQEQPVPGYSGPAPYPGGMWTTARATVRFKNGSLNMMGSVQAGLFCSQYHPAGNQAAPNGGRGYAGQQNARPGPEGGHCDAVVTYITAPENQFAEVIKIWSGPGMGRHKELDDWVAIYSQRYANEVQARTNAFLNESNNAFAARQQMYKDQAAVHHAGGHRQVDGERSADCQQQPHHGIGHGGLLAGPEDTDGYQYRGDLQDRKPGDAGNEPSASAWGWDAILRPKSAMEAKPAVWIAQKAAGFKNP